MTTLTVADCGDSALRVASCAATPDERWEEVRRLATALTAVTAPGVHGAIATYDAALIEFDCAITTHAEVRRIVDALATASVPEERKPRAFEIPVVYGGEYGPDLDVVASLLGIGCDDVIALHCAEPLTMRCFGSPGGAPMLDGPAFPQPIPRLASPRPKVAAGAVAVAGRQAVVSARPAPGGWQVLGRTPLDLVDIAAQPLSPFAPGDTFRFFPIEESAWTRYEGQVHG
ncbi:carboxyltransferase domain-containing protein [Rhodococcus sp. G-MC3]|uniref:5-oxoprolinase subunit B family protein n=1 Tax=Rhodococcus sp. G-MC3 TaxID=3046209 RepID=UPI0024BA5B05|nr:carboxyltransferase domain-containing protein [Rhodococcus sp. G-MC3]MDJ0392824.1 carboxyltransferase domain-containing protein [Rhodococcus sp. G-MC3]